MSSIVALLAEFESNSESNISDWGEEGRLCQDGDTGFILPEELKIETIFDPQLD